MKPVVSLSLFLLLSLSFLAYSTHLYTADGSKLAGDIDYVRASEGRLVWQKYNCQSCHQLYGLGGYLGPDLTNVYGDKSKGEILIRTLVTVGTGQMPGFKMSENELSDLLIFLKSVDASGKADPKSFESQSNGMISENEKREFHR